MLSEQVKDFRQNHKHLCRFVKRKPRKSGDRNGVIVVFKDEEAGTINFGWSQCNHVKPNEDGKPDSYDKDYGFAAAVDRAEPFAFHDAQFDGNSLDLLADSVVNQMKVPHSMKDYARKLVKRAYTYYKLVPSQSPTG